MSRIASSPEQDLAAHDNRVAEFLELYTTNYSRLQFYVTALLPTGSEASDVLQETSMVLWRKFDTFELGTNFFAWACKIARLQVLKFRDRQGRSAQVFDAQLLEKLAVEAAEPDLLGSVPLQALESCLAKLSEKQRTLIRRRYQPGANVSQMAAEFGRTASSISNSLSRIRKALLECVDRAVALESRE